MFARALRFLDAAYSETLRPVAFVNLSGRLVSEAPWVRQLGVRLGDSADDQERDASTSVALHGVFLNANFLFGSDGLEYYIANGRLVNDLQNASFCQELNARKNWSVAWIGRELTRRGALYSPEKKADLERLVLPAAIFSDVAMVPPLELGEVKFFTLTPALSTGPGPSAIDCVGWEVTYRSASGANTFAYFVHIEPLEGRLKIASRVN